MERRLNDLTLPDLSRVEHKGVDLRSLAVIHQQIEDVSAWQDHSSPRPNTSPSIELTGYAN